MRTTVRKQNRSQAPASPHSARSQTSAPGPQPGTDHILQLQGTIGNQAVQRVLQTSPQIARSPAPKGSTFEGMRLGRTSDSEEVVAKREVGSMQGYDERLQAIAVARLNKAEPAAVVQGYDGKWHALETTVNFYGGLFAASNTPTQAVYGLPSSVAIPSYRQQVRSLQERLKELGAMDSGGDRKAIEREREHVSQELTRARQMLASLVLGVPESEIQFNINSTQRTFGKINVVAEDVPKSSGRHGAVSGQGGDDAFTQTKKTAFEIDFPDLLDDPAEAQSTMFHEIQHQKDYEFAQEWVKKYEKESGHIFVSGTLGVKPFNVWLNKQVIKKRLSTADVELIIDRSLDMNSTTEARANVRTFLVSLQAGDPKQAEKEIVSYSKALKPGGAYANPANGSSVVAALVSEAHTIFQQMPKEMQRQFKAAVAAAKTANPAAWISKLDFSK